MWQLSTVQFDFNLPARFELEYKGEDGELHQPVMVHRALFGSVERFFGVLNKHLAYAEQVKSRLEAAGLRVELDARNEKMNAKIRDFGLQKVPFTLVVGDREQQNSTVGVRARGLGDMGQYPVSRFLEYTSKLIETHKNSLDMGEYQLNPAHPDFAKLKPTP